MSNSQPFSDVALDALEVALSQRIYALRAEITRCEEKKKTLYEKSRILKSMREQYAMKYKIRGNEGKIQKSQKEIVRLQSLIEELEQRKILGDEFD
jgi:hypothetical protein